MAAFAVPAAGAAERGGQAVTAGSVSAQAETAVSKKTLNRRIRRLGRRVGNLSKLLDGVAELTNSHRNQLNTALGALQTIEPALISLRDGLLALRAGLETAGSSIRTLATSQEYGVIGIFAGPNRLPLTMTSSDIPDDGNSAAATGMLPIQVVSAAPGSQPAGTLPPGTPLAMRAAIRSGEADGNATGDPAGQVGGLMHLKCANATGCDTDGSPTTPAAPPGTIICTVGPPPSQNFNLPDGSVRSLPLKVIQQKATRTDTTRPNADDTNVLSGSPATGSGNSTNGTCSLAFDGVYELTAQAQFTDLPTSTTPGLGD
jgi:hypothetical protein